jgi:hypothetical protein
LFCVEFKPFERLTASVTLSRANCIIEEAEHAERLGFRRTELIGKKNAITGMSDGAAVEQTFRSREHDPVVTLMSVSRTEAVIKLQFEILDHQYALDLVLDGDGTIRDCNWYASRQLTGHSREQLIGASVNSIIPDLFPIFPTRTEFACHGVHREGHVFRANVVLFKIDFGRYCCQMRRHLTHQLPLEHSPLNDLQVAGLQLGAVLGAGSFGVVRLATMAGDKQRLVAAKLVAKKDMAVALREAETLQHFHHLNIAKLDKVVETPSWYAIVMDFCPGVDMSNYIGSRPILMTVDEARHYFLQLVSAVAHVHAAGIVHRDITLQNIIVHAVVGRTSIQWHDNCIKLIDFGLSCCVEPGAVLDTFCGTPAYAAPESVLRQTPYDGFAADIWSIGVVLHCTLLGHLPFSSVSQILNAVIDPSGIADRLCADLLGKILTKEAQRRARLSQIVAHPWLADHSKWLRNRSFVSSKAGVDEDEFETPTKTKRVRIDCFSPSMEDLRSNAVQ